jgi:transposase
VNTLHEGTSTRRRRRKHSAEFKAAVVPACRMPGVSIAAVALVNRLNANLLRRWVVAEERGQGTKRIDTIHTTSTLTPSNVDGRAFVPISVERPPLAMAQEITIELRRGATVVKLGWPLAAAADCAICSHELLR